MNVSRMLRLVGWLSATVAVMVCAAQAPPPRFAQRPSSVMVDSTAAKVVVLQGDVSVLRDSIPWALNTGDTVRLRQMIITGPDGYALFELSDGSRFEVFPDSQVTFRNNPGNLTDLLDIWLGRVKVFIQKLGDKPNPHRIFTPTAVISVRGTVFDVIIEDGEDTTLVSVEEGQVSVRHRLIGESKGRVVNEGEYVRVYKDVPLAKSLIDKGSLYQKVFRAASDALFTVLVNSRTGGGIPSGGGGSPTSTGGGPTLPGDTGGGDAPAPPGNPAPPTGPPPPPSN